MIQGYWKPTPKFCLKLSLALRGLIGTVAGSAFIQGEPTAAFWILIAGAVLDFTIQCMSDDTPGGSSAVAILLFCLAITSCRTIKMETETSKLDSSWTTQKKVDIDVKGGTTAAVNFDSLREVFAAMIPPAQDGRPAQVPPQIINKMFYVPDTSGRAQLRYWIDAAGHINADCEAKAQQYQATLEEKNRLIRENKSQVKTIYKYPLWMKIAGIGLAVAFFIGLLIKIVLNGR